ncbi:MAG TPA: DUF3237 domain-containing protein [Acidimicrobiia bacterium]|nr:DUF3237 domain-containing protein [Acidimicrobiia bacterium]
MITAALFERRDPLPRGAVPARTAPVVAVAAEPRHPSNTVVVVLRRGAGPGETVRAVPDGGPPSGQGPQGFKAVLPPLEEGRQLDYRVELTRAGQRLATLPADGSWLTVTGGPPPPPPPARPLETRSTATGVPRWGYDLEFFAALTVNLRPEVLGETPEGYRINFLVDSGTVVGPRIDAVVHRDGGDWMCIRRDGIGVIDVRTTYETSDGALILDRAGGVFDLGPNGHADMVAGRYRGCPPFYASPTFMTAHPDWQWLNRLQGFGIGRVAMEKLQVQCDIYSPHVLDRLDDG